MLSFEDKKEIWRLKQSGVKAVDIAARFGVTSIRVQQIVRLAREFGLRGLKNRSTRPARLGPKRVLRIVQGFCSGVSAFELAHRFGISTTTVWSLVSGRMGYHHSEGRNMEKKTKKKRNGKKVAATSTRKSADRELRERLEYLEAENALLKKLAASADREER